MPKKETTLKTPGAITGADQAKEQANLQACNAEITEILNKYGYTLRVQQNIVFEKVQ
jgi:hypothetical protein